MRVREDPVHPLLASRPSGYVFILPLAVVVSVVLAIVYLASTRPWPFSVASAAETRVERVGTAQAAAPGASSVELRNTVSQTASEWGVSVCLGKIAAISNFLTSGVQYSALSLRGPGGDADREMFAAAISGRDQVGLRTLSTMSAAPVVGGCSGSYQTVAAFPLGCEEARSRYFSSFTEKLEFGEFVSVYRNAGDAFVYLIELEGRSCTAIKAEMLY